MKKTDLPSKIRCLSLMMLALIIMVGCHVYHNYYTYNSIKVIIKDNAAIPYGSANYNLSDLLEKVDGEIVSVKNEIDTKVVGEQEVLVEVKKDNIKKEVPIVLNVIDTVAPVINIKEEKVYITEGEEYDVNANVESVIDEVDGAISYTGELSDESTYNYKFSYNPDEIYNIGEHEVVIIAKDKTGNASTRSYSLVIEEKKYYAPVYSNAAPSVYGSDVVSIAYSLLGAPYVSGGNGPYGFDCSGFVQYVYANAGKSVTRSSWSQISDGVGISYENAEPGDILIWGYGVYPTHSAIYVGNGMMIHAANPSEGVILSSIDWWRRGGTSIISVRRVN